MSNKENANEINVTDEAQFASHTLKQINQKILSMTNEALLSEYYFKIDNLEKRIEELETQFNRMMESVCG